MWRGIRNRRAFPSDIAGSIIRDDGFSSALALKRVADKFGGGKLLVEIRVPKGTKAAYIHNIPFVQVEEFEVLFPPGAQYRVLEDRRDGKVRRMKVEVLK